MDVFEFSKDADDMGEGELRATLVDLVSKHNEQVESVEDYEAKVEEYKAEAEELQADADSGRAFFSELVAEQKDMDAETLADRFNVEELTDMVDMDAFSQEPETPEEDDESTFDDKPEKSDNLPGGDDTDKYRDDARAALERLGVASYDN